ncbi:MAG TPA: helix-turn-helix domain-containing protein, partial [Nevskiaceae bacterium]|nr:helix-turn-helix domain-containing protein [Nevskiaceae bacterium]
MNAETASPSPVAHGSPGEAIRVARERARLSLDELAARTRLSRPVLEALEKDAFEQLLEPVYVRGYYRKCAKVLDLAEQPLIDAYQAMYTPPPTVAPQRLRLASGGELGESSRLPKSFA